MNAAVQAAFNVQIKNELFSGYLYLSMSAHFDQGNLPGFARWMRLQAQEELAHAMRLFDYVLRRGGRVELHGIEAPTTDFGSPLSIFQSVFEHEQAVTGMIHALFELSGKEGDLAAQQELQWFIAEQVEEEASAATARDQMRMAGDDQAALLMLDQQLGSREGEPGEA
jgi:ferritin